MDEGEDQMHKVAIQAFKEFTGNQDELTARRLLLSCNWDVQRAINIFFMRGAPPQPIEEHKNDEKDEDIVVDEDDEIQAIQPSFEPKKRISHFVKRNKNFVEKIQTAEDKKQNKIDDNSEDNIRAPIPAVKGVMLAQTFRETYENGSARPGTSHSIFEQFRNIPPNKAFSESGEELMEETARTSTSSLIQEKYKQKAGFSPPINSFKKIKLHHREEENGKHDKESNNDRQLAMAGEEAQSTTGGFGQGAKRRKDLRLLFRPPTDLIFYGDWDKALQNARQNRLWLLVNVQNSSEFACAVLNRDIWSSEAVKDIVRTNFLFWQVYHDSSDGMRVRCYYRFETYPALFIIDPRTGEEVLKLTAPDSVTFLENLTSFLSRYPTFEARDQEFKQMALLGKKHPLLCRYNLEREKSSNSPKSPQIINSGHITTSSSDSSCGRKRKQSADDADYIDS